MGLKLVASLIGLAITPVEFGVWGRRHLENPDGLEFKRLTVADAYHEDV